MVEAGWRPTVDSYLGRVTKPRILAAVREAKGERSAQRIDHLKKADMAKEAERLLEGTGWLPEPAAHVGCQRRGGDRSDAVDGEEALPAFLTDDEDDEDDPDKLLAVYSAAIYSRRAVSAVQ